MDKRDEEFLKRINETFRIEAEEHLNAFSSGLVDLEKKQSQERYAEIIETMFREIHSLKGAARSIDQKDIESICQPLESVFSSLNLSLYLHFFDKGHLIAIRELGAAITFRPDLAW